MKRKERLNGRIKCISFLLAVVILLFSLPAGVWLAEDGGILEDGVYLLDNAYCNDNYASYGKFYLRTNGVATNTFTPTIRASTDTYGALDSDIYRYWYFEHLGNNEYVIRSMANKSQLLTITSSSLTSTIVTLREYSGSYPTNARWIISRGSYGYVLVNKAKSMSLRVNPSNSLSYVSNTQTGDPCAYLVAEIATTAYMNFDC